MWAKLKKSIKAVLNFLYLSHNDPTRTWVHQLEQIIEKLKVVGDPGLFA